MGERMIPLDQIREIIQKIPANWESFDPTSIKSELEELKAASVTAGNQELAKQVWCYETAVEALSHYINAFREMQAEKFYEGWCLLERAELSCMWLHQHFTSKSDEFKTNFIATQVEKFQALFPYKLFISPELIEHEKRCSICQNIISIRNPCGHKVGEIYNGEMCHRIITKAEVVAIAIVEKPVQKYSIMFFVDQETGETRDQHDYSIVKFLTNRLTSPFHGWSCEWTTVRHPHERFSHMGRNDKCPCESGKRYKHCCLPNKAGVLRPHCEITFEVPPPRGIPAFAYSRS
jgi:hypothetical protein